MTLGEKLSRLRKENNYTQEQLASLLGVSRQAISKWESDTAFPETEKLLRISELYDCSLDYLLRDKPQTDPAEDSSEPEKSDPDNSRPFLQFVCSLPSLPEKKSEKMLWGMPLYHIGKKARGFFAVGQDARGIIAVGLKAQGIVSLGLLSMGVLSFGVLALGALAVGTLAIGLAAAGAIAAGIIAAGAICFGVFSIGAVAIGDFAVGALAIGKYAALGDHARGMIALGDREATGSLFSHLGRLSSEESVAVRELLDSNVPALLGWAKELFKSFL